MELKELSNKMANAITHLEKDFQTLRTSRAHPSMIDGVLVEAYGSKSALNQVGNISVSDPSLLSIQVWDQNLVKSVETAILESNLGLNPQIDGNTIRLPVPKLSEERRSELSKVASQYAENSKVVIRNIRRDFIDIKKNEQKNSEISEDELKLILNEVQKNIDYYISEINQLLENKKNDILKV